MTEGKSILIADDNDDDVSFLLQGFADINVPVEPTRVRDGDSVLELLGGPHHFRLVVLDYYLPKKNAAEVTRMLRLLGKLPVLAVLSSYVCLDQRRELRESSVREVLEKPTDLTDWLPICAA